MTTKIMPAEFVGQAKTVDGVLDVGGIKLRYQEDHDGTVNVYVRRSSKDLSIMEIHIARHDGLDQEELDAQNAEKDD